MKREVIKIDSEKCNGCGECIPACPEGALQIIDGKARLVNEAYCDGLGACIGECPRNAIEIEEREAEPYEEVAVVKEMLNQGENVLEAHLEHLKEHGQEDLLKEALKYLRDKDIDIPIERYASDSELEPSCPGSKTTELQSRHYEEDDSEPSSRLKQWPVQLKLVPPQAPFFDGSNLLIVADCVPFAYGNFHTDFLGENSIVVGCPKLDDAEFYVDKLEKIIERNRIEKIKVVHMEVPCCFGLNKIVEDALKSNEKNLEVEDITISVEGEVKTSD
ncbi:4Fe-4S ferredoxin [candidate division MSBL1 archaeon SCGC-AAA259E22]|uniref:4Fe-4S ferredoxin n=2 Tax=candidate division MSBL1 TaxID=215777 RepID=A0A133UI94_9EURY|nr:4Fe-4S ferredoxin [candidate division MSBL1 archaeon SCGC-AAA259E22]